MSRYKQLLSDTLVYGLSSVLSRLVNFLLLPVYTRILSPDDYGVLNIVNTTFSIVWLLAVMALDSAAFVFFYDKQDNNARKPIFASWFWSQLTITFLFALLIFGFSGLLSQSFFNTKVYQYEFRLIAIILFVNLLPNIIWNWLRSFRRAKATALFTLTQSFIIIGLNIWFIAILHWGIKGFFWAQIISGSVMTVASLVLLKDWISFRFFDKDLLRRMLLYSLPLVPTAVALWGLNSAGGYFLQAYRGETEVGLYQTGVTIAGIMTFVIGAFTQAWGPFAMSVKNEEGAKAFYGQVFIIYISIVGVLAAGLGLFSPEILKAVATPAYHDAHWVAAILAFNSLLVGMNYIASMGMSLVKNVRPFAKASIIGALINLGLYMIGSKYIGKEGCALASLLANTGIIIYVFAAAQKLTFIPYPFRKGFVILLTCLGTMLAGKLIAFSNLWQGVILKLSLCILLFFLLFLFNRSSVLGLMAKIKERFRTNLG